MGMDWLRGVALSTTAICAVCAAGSAFAQTAPAASGSDTVQEVVVTAQKRTQSLQDVPVSVTAVGGKLLEDKRITDFSELQNVAPGITFSGSNTPRGAGVAIRGVGTVSFSDAIEGSVGIVLDGVPIGRQGAGFSDLADLERIEVLRGPQGTLFGKNASAGVINIITKRPSKALSFDGGLSYGEHGDFKARADLSGPVTSDGRVRVRVSAYDTERDGYITNVANGQKLNDRNEYGVRGKIEVDLTDTLNLLVTTDYTRREVHCCMWTVRSYGTAGLFGSGVNLIKAQQTALGIVVGPDNNKVNLSGPIFENQQTGGVAAELNWKLNGGFTLTSITAGRGWDERDNNDADQSTYPMLDHNQGDIHQRQFTQELRLTSPTGGKLDYVLGLFYFNQSTRNDSIQEGTLGLDLLGVIPKGLGLQFGRDGLLKVGTENEAAFGDATYHLTDRWRAFAGVRVTHEKLDSYFNRITPGADLLWPNVPNFKGTGSNSDTAASWRVGTQYDLAPRVMAYATIARGYKGAGFEVGLDQSYIKVVQPEIPTSYEVGVKSELFGRKLVLDAAVYYTQFDNYQAQTLITNPNGGGLAFDTANAGSVVTQGVEVDFTAVPIRDLTLSGGITYTDATFDRFRAAPCYDAQYTTGVGCVQTAPGVYSQDLSGKGLPATPKWNVVLNGRYEHDLTDHLRGFGQAGLSYRSDALLAQNQDPRSLQKAYTLVDLSAGLILNRSITLSVFAKNAFDQRYAEAIFDTPFGDTGSATTKGGTSQFIPIGAYRTVGVAIDFKY